MNLWIFAENCSEILEMIRQKRSVGEITRNNTGTWRNRESFLQQEAFFGFDKTRQNNDNANL